MSGLTALNPFFLSLLPLAALPVIFHLFFRLKKSPRPFPTLMFFHRIDSRLNARRRLREWIILLLRTLLIAFVLLGLSHPVWYGIGKAGSVAVVMILDNSGSMSGTTRQGEIKLKEALGAARALLSQLRPSDSAAITLLVPDPAVTLPPGLTADKAVLKDVLDHVAETEASGSVAAAMERARAILESDSAAHSEIHIFSDLQAEKWNQAPLTPGESTPKTITVVHRVSTRPVKANLALAGTQIQQRSVLPGRRIPAEARLVNTSASECAARLNWLDDAGNRGSQEVSVPPESEKIAAFILEPQNPGMRWVSVWLDGDDFPADNHAPLGFTCSEKSTVLFIGGAAEFGLLPLAISPSIQGKLSGLVPLFVDSSDMTARLREQPAGLVILTWESFGGAGAESAARWSVLQQFLNAGGNALLVPSTTPGTMGTPPQWLSITPGPLAQIPSGLAFSAVAKTHALFKELRDDKGEVALHNLRAFKFYPLRAASTNTPLFGLEDGRVVLAGQNVGRGSLLASGLAFDSSWSTLPLKPGFVALAQSLALSQTSSSTNMVSMMAGEPLDLAASKDAVIKVQSLAGSPLDWKGPATRILTLPRSGIYTCRNGSAITYYAVRSSEKEGLEKFLSSDALPALGKLSYSVRDLASGQGLMSEFRKLDKSLDLGWLLLLLAFAALFAEGWLANPLPMKAKPRETRPLPAMETAK